MIVYAIKIKKDCYWLGGFFGRNNYGDIVHSEIYASKQQAISNCDEINEYYGHNAKVVAVEIKEIEE